MDALHESYLEQILEQRRRRRGVLRATTTPPPQAQHDYSDVRSTTKRYIRPPTPPQPPPPTTTSGSATSVRVPASTQTSQAVVTYASHDNMRCTSAPSSATVHKMEEDEARQERLLLSRSDASAMRSRYELHRRGIASPPQIPDEGYDEGNNEEERGEEGDEVYMRDRPQHLYYRSVYRPTPRITLSQRIQQQQQQQQYNNRCSAVQPYRHSQLSQPASVLTSSRLTSATPVSHSYTSPSSSHSSSSFLSERTVSTRATRTSTYTNHRSTQYSHGSSLQARPAYTLRAPVPAPSHAADYSQGMSNNNENDDEDDAEEIHDVRQAYIAAPLLRSSSTTSRVSQPDAFSDKSNPTPSTHHSTPHPAPALNTAAQSPPPPPQQQQPPQLQATTTPLQRQETSKPVQNHIQQQQVPPQVQSQGSPREAEQTATPPPSATSSPLSAYSHTPPSPSQQQQNTNIQDGKKKNEKDEAHTNTPSQSPLSAPHATPNAKTPHGPALAFHYTDHHNVTHSPSNRGTRTALLRPSPSFTATQRNWRTHSASYRDDYHTSLLHHTYDNWRDAERGRHARSASYSATRNTMPSHMHSPIRPYNHSYSMNNDRSTYSTREQERAGHSLRLSAMSDASMERKSRKHKHKQQPPQRESSSQPSRASEHDRATGKHQHHHHHHSHNKKRGDAEDGAQSKGKRDTAGDHHHPHHPHDHHNITSGQEEQHSHRPASRHSPAHARVHSTTIGEHTPPSSSVAAPHHTNINTSTSMPTVYRLPSHALQQQQLEGLSSGGGYVRATPSQHYSLLQATAPSFSSPFTSLATHSRRVPRPLPEVRSTLDLRTSARILQAGQWFYKWCRGDSVVKQRWVWLETRSHLLVWSRKQTIHSSFSGSIPLESLWQITPRELLQPDRNGVTRIYYVLQIYTTKRTLQLATERKDKADTWFEALYNVMGFIRRHDLTRGALTPD